MVFWAGILAGGLFIWIAVRIGFYETWAMLFNAVISIYIAIFLTPTILELVPEAGDIPCCNGLALIVLATGTYLILYGITYIFLTGQFKVSFPKVFDILFAGVLGFLVGFLILSFIALIITTTPLSRNHIVSQLGLNRQSQQANISYICWWCNVVNSMVSSPDKKITSEQAIEKLLGSTQQNERDKKGEELRLNTPVEPNELTLRTYPHIIVFPRDYDSGQVPPGQALVGQGPDGHDSQVWLDDLLWPTAKPLSNFCKSGLLHFSHVCFRGVFVFSKNSIV